MAKPINLPLALWYGITDELQFGLVHGTGLCLTGTDSGCAKVYNDLGLQLLFSLFGRGSSLEMATWTQLNFASLDPATMNLQVGGAMNWVVGGNVAILAYPNFGLGLNKRDAGNKESFGLPVAAYFRAGENIAPVLFTGLGPDLARRLRRRRHGRSARRRSPTRRRRAGRRRRTWRAGRRRTCGAPRGNRPASSLRVMPPCSMPVYLAGTMMSTPYPLSPTCSSIQSSSTSSCSGENTTAPRTPNPPALLTAATTSRQWLNAKIGNSMPRRSQSGVRIGAIIAPGARRPLPGLVTP